MYVCIYHMCLCITEVLYSMNCDYEHTRTGIYLYLCIGQVQSTVQYLQLLERTRFFTIFLTKNLKTELEIE
jgi:hypothetical protein